MQYPVNDQTLTMTSREIAEVTGKRHPDVKRDIETMMDELQEDVSKFARIYTDSMKKEPRIYGSRWDKARLRFLQQHPLCVMCEQQGRITAATVVDHIEPHKLKDALKSGNPLAISKAQLLFWSKENWQPLCKAHHDSTKQRMEKSGAVIGCDANGYPLDPASHWST